MRFLKQVLAVILGFFISMGIMFLLFLVMVSFFASALGEGMNEKVSIKDNSVLVLDFTKPVTDYSEKTYFEDFDYTIKEYNGLDVILKAIEIAKTDNKIKGITLRSGGKVQGLARIKELRNALIDFKTSGKFIYAFNDAISQSDYYLQSVADSVFLSPLGEMTLKGLSSEVLFFKEAQEKSGVKMEIIRHGKYKSAVEPFLEDKMSEANRLQMTELLNSLWDVMANDISESRHISVEKLNEIANNLDARTPELALKNKLIDGIIYRDEYEAIVSKAVGVGDINDLNSIKIEKYAEGVVDKASLNKPKDEIAVIYAEGDIIYGKGVAGQVGNETIAQALREASEDDNVKAIVLRVNSPGGSALASELMHREIELAKKHKKIYVSMGNYAASGGYYISCNADRIFAEGATITGSIGVFGMLPNVSKLADKWGINAEQVQTHKNASGYSIFETPSEEFIAVTTESVEHIYDIFLERVAKGRNMTVEQVNEIAQGRVWSGDEALKIGLVDEISDLEKVVAYAAEENGVTDYQIKAYPVYKTSFKEIFEGYGASMQAKIMKEKMGDEVFEIYQKIKDFSAMKGVQARLVNEVKLD